MRDTSCTSSAGSCLCGGVEAGQQQLLNPLRLHVAPETLAPRVNGWKPVSRFCRAFTREL
eukprot:COSAG04_NODE_2902_length_3402_cov_74.177717_2_plen_60_part_00